MRTKPRFRRTRPIVKWPRSGTPSLNLNGSPAGAATTARPSFGRLGAGQRGHPPRPLRSLVNAWLCIAAGIGGPLRDQPDRRARQMPSPSAITTSQSTVPTRDFYREISTAPTSYARRHGHPSW